MAPTETAPAPDAQAPTTEPQTPPAPAPAPTPAPAPAPAPEPPASAPAGVDSEGKPWTLESYAAEVARLRNENATKRATENTKRDQAIRALAIAAGIELPDQEQAPTVESVSAALSTVTTERDQAVSESTANLTRALTAEAALVAGIPADRLDYLRFKLASDTALSAAQGTDQYGATLTSTIAALKGSDPVLSAQPGAGAGASGPDGFGGANGTTAVTQEQFDAMSYDERLDLHRTKPQEYARLASA